VVADELTGGMTGDKFCSMMNKMSFNLVVSPACSYLGGADYIADYISFPSHWEELITSPCIAVSSAVVSSTWEALMGGANYITVA
jgi:hypothetical protein